VMHLANNLGQMPRMIAVGRRGIEPGELRIKSPEALCPGGLENGRNDAAQVGLVPLVYVSQSVIAETPRVTPILDDASSGPASASGDLVADFTTRSAPPEPPWTLLLRAAQRGDDAEARALAMRLAHQVLAEPVIALAHEVLAGGPHAAAKAIELAERLLAGADVFFAPPKADVH